MYLLVAFCLTTVASAQKLTEKDIQGTWKMVSLDAPQMKIDVATEKIVLSPEMEAQMTPEMKQQMEAGMAEAFEVFKESYAYVEGKNLRQAMGPEERKGTFVIAQKDGKNVMTFTTADGTSEEIIVALADKKLSLTLSGGGESATFTYVKQ